MKTTSGLLSAPQVAVARYVPAAAVLLPSTAAHPGRVRVRCQERVAVVVSPAGKVIAAPALPALTQSLLDQIRSEPDCTKIDNGVATVQLPPAFFNVAVKDGAVPAGYAEAELVNMSCTPAPHAALAAAVELAAIELAVVEAPAEAGVETPVVAAGVVSGGVAGPLLCRAVPGPLDSPEVALWLGRATTAMTTTITRTTSPTAPRRSQYTAGGSDPRGCRSASHSKPAIDPES